MNDQVELLFFDTFAHDNSEVNNNLTAKKIGNTQKYFISGNKS